MTISGIRLRAQSLAFLSSLGIGRAQVIAKVGHTADPLWCELDLVPAAELGLFLAGSAGNSSGL